MTQSLRRSAPLPGDREVYCLLGLPLDAIGLDQAVEHVLAAVRDRRRCFLSTPNLNFAVAAQRDPAFRDTLLRSDLSLVDGMPLVWLARCLGLPLPERVAGANLFERLRSPRPGQPPLKVYLFGGAEGVAARAAAVLNAEGGGTVCVGHASPGFGDLAALSAPAIIKAINASDADFLLVALGARKGQAWIDHNLAALVPPVVCHLGAVINFVAGTVRRAPLAWQRVGLEWLWRIGQEPTLWRRYAGDAACALQLVGGAVLPALWRQWRLARRDNVAEAWIAATATPQGVTLRLEGSWTTTSLPPLRHALRRYANGREPLTIEAGAVTRVDSAVIAQLLLLRRHRLDRGDQWRLRGLSPDCTRLLDAYGAGELLASSADE